MKNLVRRAQATVRRHPTASDVALALVFAAAALISVKSLFDRMRGLNPSFNPPATVAVVAAMLGISLPLALRRRLPFSAAIAVVVAFLVGRIVLDARESAITVLAASLAIYSAALHGRRRFRTGVLAVCLGAILIEVGREVLFRASATDVTSLTKSFVLTYNVVVLSLPWVLGAVIRSLREREGELAERAAELQREREENARQAVFAERVRIARELHDVVAHHVSVMGVQAGAARRVMGRQPDKAAEALSSIEASSRQAVLEMHRLLAYLRRAGDTDELAPQPGLAQLDDLVAQEAGGDLAVDLKIEGDPRALSPTLEVSAYRIVQEALTNTRKHSGGASATVRVRYGPAALEVEVFDDGTGREVTPIVRGESAPIHLRDPLVGHGLIGMRERATLHGGHLSAGPRQGGGFSVHATFPLNAPPR